MSTETFIAAYAMSDGIAVAHAETAWNALLSGDIDAALAAKPRYIDLKSGEMISRRAAERHFAATASAAKPSTVEAMNALTAQIYAGDGPWGRRRS